MVVMPKNPNKQKQTFVGRFEDDVTHNYTKGCT